ncbi:MAG: tetratricopeptide repeat protein [Kineosporiaceae bacterium]|nr:tetratricopeptide repeat protein [Kineosporiaceae bacterium]
MPASLESAQVPGSSAPRGRFVGVGVGTYESDYLPDLPRAVSDVTTLAHLLAGGFDGEPLTDPQKADVEAYLGHVRGSLPEGGSVVGIWAGHGTPSPVGVLQLPAANGTDEDSGNLTAQDFVAACVRSGANQIVIVLDTCFSGAATFDAASLSSQLIAHRPPDAEHVWVGVLASCQPWEKARDGTLGEVLCALLREGPSDPQTRVYRWSAHQRLLRGDDLCDAVLKAWTSRAQEPMLVTTGSAWYMIPNPLYRAGAAQGVVEHLLLAARGGAGAKEVSAFTGRRGEVDTVVGWVRERAPGVFVVTGPPGTGKSAIVGRVVSLADPVERARLRDEPGWHGWGHADPGEGSVHANVHARGLTADRMAELLDAALIAAGILTPALNGRARNAGLLVGQLQQDAEADGWVAPVIVVDGLDEARGEVFSIVEDLLSPLAAVATVVIATRQVVRGGDQPDLIQALAPHGPGIDLGIAMVRAAGLGDVRAYLVRRLDQVRSSMDAVAVADHVTTSRPGEAGVEQPFLLARIVADQLRAHPVDTSQPHWQSQVASSYGQAFDLDLARIPAPPDRVMPAGSTPSSRARVVLTALTWAFGAGFPAEEWLTVAQARAPEADLKQADIWWVLAEAGRFIVQDGEHQTAVYRMAHQSLADLLRARFDVAADAPFDPDARPVALALTDRYQQLMDAGVPAQSAGYLWRYVWRHSAACGPDGLDMLRGLAATEPALRNDLALAAGEVSQTFRFWGRRQEALAPTQEAVDIYRELAATNPAFRPDLASSLNNLGVRLSNLGRRQEALDRTQEAVTLYGTWPPTPAFQPNLASSLNNLGGHLSNLGRRQEALDRTQEAVTLYRDLAATNPAFRPGLAGALNNLGVCLSELGRRQEALAPIQEAVTLYRDLAATNPAFRPDLAGALTNLGGHLSNLGRRQEALDPTQEAVTLYRDLAATNPAFRPDLASALTNLGVFLGELGRRQEALDPTQEAVTLYRDLAATNPAFRPDLASALTNLGVFLRNLGRRQEALDPTQEAVTLYRDLAATNPAFRPDLARALNNLGVRLSNLGRRQEALDPTQEAVTLYRDLAATNPAFRPDLAMSLNNLGVRLSELGRRQEALDPTQEAVTLYRDLAATNPAFRPDLASSLNNLGVRLSELGRRQEALAPAQEAVTLYRDLAATNPAFRPNLASSLNNLGVFLGELGRREEALDPTQEAVTLYRDLAATNPAFRPNLASSLNNLGVRLSELGRRQEALDPTQEAVTLYRDLAATNPAFQPNLASSLTNLGGHLSNLGRRQEALDPTQEAVTLYRDLAATNPAFQPDLASALTNLGIRLNDLGQEHGDLWEPVVEDLSPAERALLLLYRSTNTSEPAAEAASWICRALVEAGEDQPVLAALRDQARRHRAGDPAAFDAAWATATTEPTPPAWLHVDPTLLAAAQAWVQTETYEDEQAHLVEHPELLTTDADGAVDEALLPLDPVEAARYQQLRDAARVHGVQAAYRPLLLAILTGRLLAATGQERRLLLTDHRDDLLDDTVHQILQNRAADEDQDVAMAAAEGLALIILTGLDATGSTLTAVLDALEEPTRFAPLLQSRAVTPDAVLLQPVAEVAWSYAVRTRDDRLEGLAGLYLATAAAITHDTDTALALLDEARELTPDQRDTWVGLLLDITAHHPTTLPLVQHLMTPPHPTSDTGNPLQGNGSPDPDRRH